MNHPHTRPILLLVAWLTAAATAAPVLSAQQPAPSSLTELSRSFEALARRVSPAVVQIYSTALAPLAGDPRGAGPFLGEQGRGGSGVIVSSDGYIVTNAHVVEGSRRLHVMLAQPVAADIPGQSLVRPVGRRLDGRVVGTDLETDLAVVKVDAADLPFLEFGDSDELHQGHVVLAFGSPLGLETSVTMGVVSAVGRQLEPDDPMVYVQTDAPINPGNSGGPLVDTEGRVVGINTLTLSQSGGSEGIGFAAPSNIARTVYEQIRDAGYVRRGTIGVHVQTITPVLAAGLRLTRNWGAIVSDVYPRSPAARAGLQAGDIIISLDGKLIENARQFTVNVYQHRVDDVIALEVRRALTAFTVRVPVVERPNDPGRFADLVDEERNLVRSLGVLAVEFSERVAPLLPWARRPGGVVVAARSLEGPPMETGLEPGDVIYAINGSEITTIGQLTAALRQLNPRDPVVLHVDRRGQYRFIAFEKQ